MSKVEQVDVTSPLYLHPSDGSKSITKLGERHGDTLRFNKEAWAEMWDIVNCMVISRITGSVSPSIAKSILFVNSAIDIWVQLKRRFFVNNGVRKRLVNEYFTEKKASWEELESMNDRTPITNMTQELFQFLVGLVGDYGTLRS
ncbi:DNA-directed RNA polymerase subunit beta [Bienertia sinuspersici]